MPANNDTLVALTADIVATFAEHHSISMEDLTAAILVVHATLVDLDMPDAQVQPARPIGAVSARASIKPQHLISMIDGKPYSMLKRHLFANGYTPESYREAFGLPRDYPMTSVEYTEKRRSIAYKIGLGRKPKTASDLPKSNTPIHLE